MEDEKIKIAIAGYNQEKNILSERLTFIRDDSTQFKIEIRLREIDKEIEKLLIPKEII